MEKLHDFIISKKNLYLLLEYKKKFRDNFETSSPIILKSILSNGEVDSAVSYFQRSECYCAHVPQYAQKILSVPDLNTDYPYLSYDIKTSLKCEELRKIINNKCIKDIVSDELGTKKINLYSINTFWTINNKSEHFTHGFHRDEDGINFVTVFVNLTDTKENDGHFEYIKNTANPRELIAKLDEKKINPQDFYNINPNSTNGYYKNDYYTEIFGPPVIVAMNAGSVCISDTWGLHRGTPVKKNRLVSWLRFSDGPNTAYRHDSNRLKIGEFMNMPEHVRSELLSDSIYEIIVPNGINL